MEPIGNDSISYGTSSLRPIMWKTSLFSIMLLASSASFAVEPDAGVPVFRPVNSGDLLGGYIPDGEWIETSGYAWFKSEGVYFNVNKPSARPLMRVDVEHADPGDLRHLASECASPDQFRGGCCIVIRGQTGKIGGRQGIFAREMRVLRTSEIPFC